MGGVRVLKLSSRVQGSGAGSPLDYLIQAGKSKSDEIGTEAKMDETLGAKVIMCTPVHGLSGFSTIDQT